MKTINYAEPGRAQVISWCDLIEPNCLEQVDNVARLPFVFGHIALMPDAHYGYGVPIGSVLATEDVIVPNAVGVDIGCGVLACNTRLQVPDKDVLTNIRQGIKQVVPMGFNWHPVMQAKVLLPDLSSAQSELVHQHYDNARVQVGTLGGGNHFIELQADEQNNLWIMIHSGSRNLGKQVAVYYNNSARKINKCYYSLVPQSYDLAFLPRDTQECQDYLDDMEYCVKFARANRYLMFQNIINVLQANLHALPIMDKPIDVAHNYVRQERHFGRDVYVYRKGAISALLNQLGIIPGSQGSPSYIVNGLGNRMSYNSCSHGAGRSMGREAAKKSLNLEQEIKKLDDQGILHTITEVSQLDEAVGAYKDIEQVMQAQQDLVQIITKLRPVAVLKGE